MSSLDASGKEAERRSLLLAPLPHIAVGVTPDIPRESLGMAAKAIIRQVRRKCPHANAYAHAVKAQQHLAQAHGVGGGASGGAHAHGKKATAKFSPGMLCAGARGLGLDLGGFQAVTIAAAEVRGADSVWSLSYVKRPFEGSNNTLRCLLFLQLIQYKYALPFGFGQIWAKLCVAKVLRWLLRLSFMSIVLLRKASTVRNASAVLSRMWEYIVRVQLVA